MAETTDNILTTPGADLLATEHADLIDAWLLEQGHVSERAEMKVTIATLIAERDRALAALDAMGAERDAARDAARKVHRRAQAAEGKLQRAQTWIDMREGDKDKGSPYVRREMEHFYFRHVLAALATQEKPQGIPAGKEG